MRTDRIRPSMFFALGAATALLAVVSLSAWRADAAPGDGDTTFFPIAPCRLFDYRPAPNTVGTRTSPLGPGEIYQQQVTGTVGDCSIPAGADAVSMNVTIVLPTEDSHLTMFPADETSVPTVANLNWLAGQAPTPNKVDVKLSPRGAVKLFNLAGSVYVVGDVAGYYSDASLDDIQARLAALEVAQPYVAEVSGSPYSGVSLTTGAVKALNLPTYVAPADGRVVLTGTAWLSSAPAGEDAYCAILPSSASPGADSLWTYPGSMIFEPEGLSNDGTVSGTTTFAVSAGQSLSYSLWCQREPTAASAEVYTRTLVMTYLPG